MFFQLTISVLNQIMQHKVDLNEVILDNACIPFSVVSICVIRMSFIPQKGSVVYIVKQDGYITNQVVTYSIKIILGRPGSRVRLLVLRVGLTWSL